MSTNRAQQPTQFVVQCHTPDGPIDHEALATEEQLKTLDAELTEAQGYSPLEWWPLTFETFEELRAAVLE
jgi:hypothetical protein